MNSVRSLMGFSVLAVLAGGLPAAPGADGEQGAKDLLAKIESLKVADVAWRQIPWKTCLLDGLIEARRSHKPLMLWVFIDRPKDDTRC